MAAPRTPQDRKPKDDGTVKVTWQGLTFTVGQAEDWDADILWELENEHLMKATAMLLGEAQFAKFRGKKPTIKKVNEFWEHVQKVVKSGN